MFEWRYLIDKCYFFLKRSYKIGNYNIYIPLGYKLPLYQRKFKLYDQFLPVLAKELTSDEIIIDVGANIGDTAIAILQNCTNSIICVEPSDIFYSYLQRNIKKIAKEDLNRIKIFKNYIGSGLFGGVLKHSQGTAKVSVSRRSNDIVYKKLDDLVEDKSHVILLKVDTDGFDYDVIMSAKKILSKSEPILFWENQIDEDFQFEGFNELYKVLEGLKYEYIFIFDNFGNLMIEKAKFNILRSLNAYIFSMGKYNCTRTIYYTDVLACTKKNYATVKNSISKYKEKLIKNENINNKHQ